MTHERPTMPSGWHGAAAFWPPRVSVSVVHTDRSPTASQPFHQEVRAEPFRHTLLWVSDLQ